MRIFSRNEAAPTERLRKSQRQLKEFMNTPTDKRLDECVHLLCPAVSRIHSVVHGSSLFGFNKIDLLNADYLYTDIRLIPFFSEKYVGAAYISYNRALQLPYPTGDYEVLEPSIGKCRDEESGKTFFSPRIAVDTSVEAIAQRWLDNIPAIIDMI